MAAFDKIPSGHPQLDEILDYIRKTHEEYMQKTRSVEEDCEFITRVCSHVLSGVLCLAEEPVLVFAA